MPFAADTRNAAFGPDAAPRPRRSRMLRAQPQREALDMLAQALREAGGVADLAARAHRAPAAFLRLVGQALPLLQRARGSGPLIVQLKHYSYETDLPLSDDLTKRPIGPS